MKYTTNCNLLIVALFSIMLAFLSCNGGDPEPPAPPKPNIQSVDPTKGIVGDPVIIKGENLQNATKVTFNTNESIVTQTSSSGLTTVVPPNATIGVNNITVFNGGIESNKMAFEVVKTPEVVDPLPPTVQRTVPATNYIDFPVLIYGDNLSGVIELSFNDKPAVIFTNNQKVITTAVPKGLTAGTVKIKVRTVKGVSSIDFQVQGAPPAGITPGSFAIISVPPPNYVPSISNNWSCGLFSEGNGKTFVELNSDNNFDQNYKITGRYEYSFNKSKNYNTLNYVEFTNKTTGETLAGQFSSKFDKPCILNMVLISSKTGNISTCTFNLKSNFPDLVCQ